MAFSVAKVEHVFLYFPDQLQQSHEAPNRLQQAFTKILSPFTRHAVKRDTPALGQGSFGSVHEFLIQNTIIVAGKIYRVPSPNDIENYVRHFNTLFVMLIKLKHRNIVHYLGVSFVPKEKFPVLLMERCECNLEDFLKSPFCKDPTETVGTKLCILRDIAKGLNYLHNQSPAIVHRDITASNILLDKHHTAKIADFGQSKLINQGPGAIPVTMTVMGTALHLPPEASEMTYDEKIDIFSFGHLSLFTLTQEAIQSLPSAKKCDMETGKPILISEVERRQEQISKVASIVGNEHFIMTIIHTCLSDFPKDRPSASELLKMFPDEVIGK